MKRIAIKRLSVGLRSVFVLIVTFGLIAATSAHAARNLAVESQGNGKRVALVIGNSTYKSGPLTNPVNDAKAMAATLRRLGFDVILRENLKTREIGSVYQQFRTKIVPGGVALVFYAGHGVQFKGENYFPAVDADINIEEDVPLQSVNLNTLLSNMEEAKAGVSLVFLDACRDNPFARRFRSGSRGLAKVEAASGTLIHYATRPGSVADDGDGKNGTYTEALLAQINEPGVPVEMMLKRVANNVVDKTGGKQEPWVEGHLRGEFYFIFKGPATVNVQQAPTDPETEVWQAAEQLNTEAAYRSYLDAYPKGRYILAAKLKLDALSRSATVEPEKTAVSPAPTFSALDAEQGWLGVSIQEISPELSKAFGQTTPSGVLVSELDSDGPAAKAGFAVGDVILAFQGKFITRPADLPPLVFANRPREKVSVEALRNGKRLSFDIILGKRPAESPSPNERPTDFLSEFFMGGFSFKAMNASQQQHLTSLGFQLNPEDRIMGFVYQGTITQGVSAESLIEQLGNKSRSAGIALLVKRGNRAAFLAPSNSAD